MQRKIVILVHPATIPQEVSRWAIHGLALVWQQSGIEVTYQRGVVDPPLPQADVLIVHIDLSVVPEPYLEFAAKYPVAINGKVRDIRKSAISSLRVVPGDGWEGPVIVKSDLNCCGLGELMLHVRDPQKRIKMPTYPFKMERQTDYRVYDAVAQVPREYFSDSSVIVERFMPERQDGLYFVRSHHFLGSKGVTVRLGSAEPVVLGQTTKVMQTVEPHQSVLEFRQRYGLQYGKIDYVEHDGKAFIFDVNKTTGDGAMSKDPRVMEMRRQRALGIYDFLPRA